MCPAGMMEYWSNGITEHHMKGKTTFLILFFIFIGLLSGYSFSRTLKNDETVVSSFDLFHVKGGPDEQVDVSYPPYYDLREQGRVTPVKTSTYYFFESTQYSAYACLESLLLPSQDRNFSEPALAVFFERYDHYNRRTPLLRMAVTALVAWEGPKDHPEEGYTYWSVGGPDTVQEHIQQVVFLPERDGPLDNNTVKWFIINDGAVYTQLYYVGSLYDYENKSYYHFGYWGGPESWPDFATAIVGWDDHFDKNNFKYPAPGDGAFIAKNCWGEPYGMQGYFYVSYYDSSLVKMASFNNAEDVTNYGDIYQYDILGPTTAIGNGSTVYWGANVFIARDNSPLEAVSFYANDTHVNYEITIYKGISGGSPVRGSPAAFRVGAFIYPGYYTVKLAAPVPLNRGETFSVVIKFQNSNSLFPLIIEAPVEDYSSNAAAESGESYISSNGHSWQDLTLPHPGSNACIKAFTAYTPAAAVPVISLETRTVVQKMWLITKTFGLVSFYIDNLPDTAVREIVLYRKTDERSCEQRDIIRIEELQNGTYTYIEEHLLPGHTYTYHVALYAADDRIIAKSNEAIIKME